MNRWPKALQDERAQYVLLVLLSVPYVWLIWSVPFLPMQDLAGHIELSFLHERLGAHDPSYTPFYEVAQQPWPNSLSTLLLSVMGRAVGLAAGVKVLLSLYAIGWPLSLGSLARQLGRPPLIAMFALPTVLDFSWGEGFFNYVLAKPVMALALAVACLFARAPKLKHGMLLLGILVVAFLTHAIAYGLGVAAAAFAIVFFSRGYGRVVNLWPIALAGLAPVHYLRAQAAATPTGGAWVMYDFDTGFAWFWTHLGNLSPGNGEEWAYTLSFALWLLLLTLQQHDVRTNEPDAGAKHSSLFVWLSGFAMFAAYGWGPAHMPNVDIICPRVLVLAWVLMLLLAVRLPERAAQRGAFTAAMFAIGLLHAYTAHNGYERFNRVEMAGFEQLMRQIPPGKSLATHYFRHTSPFAANAAMWHWPKLYGVWQGGGGHTDDSFSIRSTSYITMTERARGLATYSQDPGLHPELLKAWDYLLIHGGVASGAQAAVGNVGKLVGSSAEWYLFRIER